MVDDHFDREHRYSPYMYQSVDFFRDLEREFSIDRMYVVRNRVHELVLKYRWFYPKEKDHCDRFQVCMSIEHYHRYPDRLHEV